jgi:hypothetical protein
MKKFVMLAVFALGAFALSFAQTQGSVFIGTTTNIGGGLDVQGSISGVANGGGFGIYKTKYEIDGEKTDIADITVFNLAPRVGYFFIDNLVGGVKFNVYSSNMKDNADNSNYEITDNGFAGGPFLRYYFDLGNARPFIEAEAIFGTMKEKDNDNNESKMNSTQFGGGVGLAVFFNDFLAFDIMAGYTSTTFKDPDVEVDAKVIINGFGLGLGLTMILGTGSN